MNKRQRKKIGSPVVFIPPPMKDNRQEGYANRPDVIHDALEKGNTIVYGSNSTLTLDFDDVAPEQHEELLGQVNEKVGFIMRVFNRGAHVEYQHWVSSSGNGLHVTVHFVDTVISIPERIFLQLFLGSDPIRELLNWNDVFYTGLSPNDQEPFLVRPGIRQVIAQLHERDTGDKQ